MAQSSDRGESQDRASSSHRGKNLWLLVVGMLAAIAMLIPAGLLLSIGAAYDSFASVFLLRLLFALVILASPFLFLLLLGSRIVSWLLGGGRFTFVAGAALTLVLLAIPPYLGNNWLDSQAKALFAEDHNDETKPSAKVIAIRGGGAKPVLTSNEVNCDGLCQRLLMNGKRVLVLNQDVTLAIDPNIEVDSFRLERRASCPEVTLPPVVDPVRNDDSRADSYEDGRAEALMRLEIAKGNCLISEKTPLRIADTILSAGVAHHGGGAFCDLSLFADTVSADRITVHERHNGTFRETLRQTLVTAQKLFPFYAPIVVDKGCVLTSDGKIEQRTAPTLPRYEKIMNSPPAYEEEFGWSGLWRDFLRSQLGADLVLHSDTARKDTRMVLNNAMRRRTVNALEMQIAADFMYFDEQDLVLALRLMTDERFPISRDASAVVRAVRKAKGAKADNFEIIAASMFKRLRDLVAGAGITPHLQPFDEANNIADVIWELPRETILRHRDDLEWLARQDPKWDRSDLAKQQLSELDGLAQQAK
jgi:hypothetical protein